MTSFLNKLANLGSHFQPTRTSSPCMYHMLLHVESYNIFLQYPTCVPPHVLLPLLVPFLALQRYITPTLALRVVCPHAAHPFGRGYSCHASCEPYQFHSCLWPTAPKLRHFLLMHHCPQIAYLHTCNEHNWPIFISNTIFGIHCAQNFEQNYYFPQCATQKQMDKQKW
jgi:hypothetical protein